MNKKIIIGSIFAALLIISTPFISAFQLDTEFREKFGQEPDVHSINYSDSKTISIEKTVVYSEKFIDCFSEELDEEFVQQLQGNLNLLNNEMSSPLFCEILWSTIEMLYDYFDYLCTTGVGYFILGNIWLLIYYLSQIYANNCDGNNLCGCSTIISSLNTIQINQITDLNINTISLDDSAVFLQNYIDDNLVQLDQSLSQELQNNINNIFYTQSGSFFCDLFFDFLDDLCGNVLDLILDKGPIFIIVNLGILCFYLILIYDALCVSV